MKMCNLFYFENNQILFMSIFKDKVLLITGGTGSLVRCGRVVFLI